MIDEVSISNAEEETEKSQVDSGDCCDSKKYTLFLADHQSRLQTKFQSHYWENCKEVVVGSEGGFPVDCKVVEENYNYRNTNRNDQQHYEEDTLVKFQSR